MTGVLWGLLGAVLIGCSDAIARVTAQRVSLSILFLAVMGLSTAALTVRAAVLGDWPDWHLWGYVASAGSGFLNLVALYFLYRALARGPVSVASPAASSFSVILVAINALVGEPFSLLQVAAAVIVFGGVVMLARPSAAEQASSDITADAQWLRITALLGLGAAVSVAVRMFLAQEAGAVLGPTDALYLNRIFALIGVLLLIGFELSRRYQHRFPGRKLVPLVLLQAALETSALGAFLIGSAGSGRVGAAIGFSAFAAVTALVAWLWLGDRVSPRRMVWMAVVAGGVALAVVGSPV